MSTSHLSLGELAVVLTSAVACSGQADTTPPALLNLSINPTTVNVSNGPVTTHWRMEVSDDLSGLTWSRVDFFVGNKEYDFGRDNYVSSNAGALHYIMQFEITFPSYAVAGSYAIRLQLEDVAQNLVVFMAGTGAQSGFVRDFPPGFPSTITVINQPSAVTSYTAVATIPHLAIGGAWQTTLRLSGLCSVGCSLTENAYDPNGTLMTSTASQIPPSTQRWVRSDTVPATRQETTGWVEVIATSTAPLELCASALFTNAYYKQEASSPSDCTAQSGWASRSVGNAQYFYSHVDGYTSGIALLNKGTIALTVQLQWHNATDNIVAERIITTRSQAADELHLDGGGWSVRTVHCPTWRCVV